MEIDKCEIAEGNVQAKEPEERSLRSSAERIRLSLSSSHSQSTSSKSDQANAASEITDKQEIEHQVLRRPSVDADAHAIYNFDQYSHSSSVTKRGRGRPRKDGRNPVEVHHRKIYPGRSRARARKINRHLFAPTTSELIKGSVNKDDSGYNCDTRELFLSGDEKHLDEIVSSTASVHTQSLSSETAFKEPDVVRLKAFCSFCKRGENSCLGQGKLDVFPLTPGFTFKENLNDKDSLLHTKISNTESDAIKVTLKRTKSMRIAHENILGQSQKLYSGENILVINQETSIELAGVGFDEPPEPSDIFLTSGEINAHYNCAIWSDGVKENDDTSNDSGAQTKYCDVDKAVLSALSQKCSSCDRYGASVKCSIQSCDKLYHFPCAVICGTLQNAKTLKIACSSHEDAARELGISCSACYTIGKQTDLLYCTLCFKHYHSTCLEPCIDIVNVIRTGWQCIECKRCQTCKQPGDENRMLVCETCDKGYHTFCLKPTVATVPKNGWKCQNCRICGDCGARTPGSGPSSRWHLNYTICDSCYQQRNKGIACPLCGKAYRQFLQKRAMRHCCVCRKYIHFECDPKPEQTVNPLEYVCPICVNPTERLEDCTGRGNTEHANMRGKIHDSSISPPEIFPSSSRDSFSTENDNSSETESDSAAEFMSGHKYSGKSGAKTDFQRERRKKTTKMKRKTFSTTSHLSFSSSVLNDPKTYKTEDDDPSGENKMILVSTVDEFALCQDLCVMCGSFGKGDEGRLIACAQCGQCYHSYCASIKVTSVVLRKGWRCLDCTVCEGCGKPHDESRLLLCDECDISFHTYCLDPPLPEVPPGNWKCKWCVICIKCSSRSPGYKCNWQMNYTLCGPCASTITCPICSVNYEENELLILCSDCKRWVHGTCDQILNEESAEICSECGYSCPLCRPVDEPPAHLLPSPMPPSPEPEPVIEKPSSPVPKVREQDIPVKSKVPIQFYLDGVCLSEIGLQHIKSLTPEIPKKVQRPRKTRQSVFGTIFGNTSSIPMKFPQLQNPNDNEGFDTHVHTQQDLENIGAENISDLRCDLEPKLEISDEKDCLKTNPEFQRDAEDMEKKKKPRKIQKLGIGGFVVKPRGRSSLKETLDEGVILEPSCEPSQISMGDTSLAVGSESSDIHAQEKPKRRRKPKKKTPLDESFPSYLRDAFFGKDLLLSCKKTDSSWEITQDDTSVDSSNASINQFPSKDTSGSSFNQSSNISCSEPKETAASSLELASQSLNDKTSSTSSQNVAFPDMKEIKTEVISSSNEDALCVQNNEASRNFKECIGSEDGSFKEETAFNFDIQHSKDIPSLSVTTSFPKMDSKDIEDVIEGALRDQNVSQSLHSNTNSSPLSLPHSHQSSPFGLQRPAVQMHAQSSPVHRENTPNLQHQDSNSSWSESESSEQAPMPKSTMKWEADETLGLQSTISPVLYANINCPHLKLEFPNWCDRVKQIAKIWRSLPSEKRQPYLQKARENRAASRTQKASSDIDRSSKEIKLEELDQEKQWKQFQALRQLQQQKQQKLQDQKAQSMMKVHTDKLDTPQPFTDLDCSLKLNHPLADVSVTGLHSTEATTKSATYDNSFSKKWVSDPVLSKIDDLNSQNTIQQPTLLQGRTEMPSPVPLGNSPQGRPHPPSPFIQVTRVHPPVDSLTDSISMQEQPNIMQPEQYNRSRPSLSPRGLLPPHNQITFPPTSPVSRHSLLIARSEITRAMTPLQKELLYVSPSVHQTHQNSESTYPNTVSPRNQFLSPIESQPASGSNTPHNPDFSPNRANVGIFNIGGTSDQYPSDFGTNPKEIPNSKTFYAPQNSSHMTTHATVIDVKKIQALPVSGDQFMHQQSAQARPVHPIIHKELSPQKEDLYHSISNTSHPTHTAGQENVVQPHSLENVLKETPDPNKLAHHQLKELLQKQQMNSEDEDTVFSVRNKDSASYQDFSKGGPNPAFPFITKDDCFRHPLPPTQRMRNISVKEEKPDVPQDHLSSKNIKMDILQNDENIAETEAGCKVDESAVSLKLSAVKHHETRETESGPIIRIPSSVSETENKPEETFKETKNEKISSEINLPNVHEENKSSSDIVSPDNQHVETGAGTGKKRKTTAGDLVKDLESQPEEPDVIASACNLDGLTGDVGELELDDDELLGLGNDFNILEYADPELDKGLVGEGEKSNILDEHLDLDDKDELEDEEEIKSQPNAEEKDSSSHEDIADDKRLLNPEVNDVDKTSETQSGPPHMQQHFIKYEKKEDRTTDFQCREAKSLCSEKTENFPEPVKKEMKSTFRSCSLSGINFCSSDESTSKEKETLKELHSSRQQSVSFSSSIDLGSQEETPFSSQIDSPTYRVANAVQQNVSPPASHYQQQSPLVSPQQNVFSLHVGMRPAAPVIQTGIIPTSAQSNRPLLLQEQPLLLEDLVEQEKREQLRQNQEGLISPHGDALLSDIDFERLKDDVFSGPPDDSLGGPGSLLGSHDSMKTVVPSGTSTNTAAPNFGPPPYSIILQNQDHGVHCTSPARGQPVMQPVQQRRTQVSNVLGPLGLPHGIVLHGEPSVRAVQPQRVSPVAGSTSVPFVSNFMTTPPSPPVMDPHTEQEKQKIIQYEKFLIQQQAVLSNQQKYFETEVIKLRKMKKALNAKQRQLRKNGSELAENDALELTRITQEQAGLQKQLDQVRKQSRQHSIALQDFRLKQQKRQVAQNQIHVPLRSPPQNQRLSLQMSQVASPSPLLPSSPVLQNPSHIQTSSIIQHSSASISSSGLNQQPLQAMNSHLLPQVQFQLSRPGGKEWCNVSQLPQECLQKMEKMPPKELPPKPSNVETGILSTISGASDKMNQGDCMQRDSETHVKYQYHDGINVTGTSIISEERLSKTIKRETVKHTFSTAEGFRKSGDMNEVNKCSLDDTVVTPEKSILSQSLPSSVTNTLNFTLRQTGMPTVCLPTSASNEQIQPTDCEKIRIESTNVIREQVVEKTNLDLGSLELPSTSVVRRIKCDTPVAFPCEKNNNDNEIQGRNTNSLISGGKKLSTALSDSANGGAFHKETVSTCTAEEGERTSIHASKPSPTNTKISQEIGRSSNNTKLPVSDAIMISEIHSARDIKVEHKNDEIENEVLLTEVKKEIVHCSDNVDDVNIPPTEEQKQSNEASSDEELESLTKKSHVLENDQDQGKQNVLLKQLLQNCPSAETSRKQETLADVKKEDLKSTENYIDESEKDHSNKKSDEMKLKKPSYLDIRRAQLEREPTPPPFPPLQIDGKSKTVKRKRPKKKKNEGKDVSPIKKKCQRSSLSKSEDSSGTPLESLMNQLTSLPPLRVLEPSIQPNFNILPVSGAGDLNAKENQLKGTYGNALLPNQSDIYSYYPYGKEHAPPILALPPSPPYRGFYSQEFPPLPKGKSESSLSRSYPSMESEGVFRDIDSPDTVLSSSSPECCMFEPLCNWPELVFCDSIDHELDQKKSYSPVIPIIAPIPVRLTSYAVNDLTNICYFDKEKDKENIPKAESKSDIGLLKSKMCGISSYSTPLKDTGNVSVTLTLSSAAAEDICSVLSRLAEVLKIPIPATYEIVERTSTPPSQKLGLYPKNSDINIQTLLNGKPRFCRHCDIVVLSAGIRKKASDLACITKEEQEEEEEVIFCSTNCYMQFALTHRSSGSNLEDKEAATVVAHQGEKNEQHDCTTNSAKQSDEEDLSTEESTILMDDMIGGESSSQESSSKICIDASDENTVIDEIHMEVTDTEDLKSVETEGKKIDDTQGSAALNEESVRLSLSSDCENTNIRRDNAETQNRRWKCLKYKYWRPCSPISMCRGNKEDTAEKVIKPFYHTVKPSQMPKDGRKCILCHVTGDGDTNGVARLLNMDVDKWVHLNCALWSAEVYETVNGALMNVELAYKRAAMLICCSCHKPGASLKCFKMRCSSVFHFPCAMREHCVFFKDKTLLCSHHAHKGGSDNELDSLAVFRRVYIDRDEHKQVASMIQGDQYLMRIGSLVFLSIGQLLPQQMQAFHTSNCIYPVGYKAIRFYWSMRKLGKRCQYICSINDIDGKPEFHIQVKESDHKDIVLKDKTSKGLWQKVLYPIEKMRKQAKTIKIFPDFITGDDLFGLTEPAVLRIVESLPGVDTLQDYNFRYGRSPFLELPLAINPTGCARSEPKLRTHVKRSHTLHTSNSSRCTFHTSFGGAIEISSPYVKQFVHSKSSQYRKMKTEWRNNVYLARSRIQGLGLYAARDLEKHTMVIEYIGQLIRNEIAERNEAIYDAQNRGIYMFRLDENRVIDATICGGLARYINHSCNPNCVAENVQIDRDNKILIIANRRISRGEELSYDYKFEVEDDQHKIPCLCKAPNCRKWMN